MSTPDTILDTWVRVQTVTADSISVRFGLSAAAAPTLSAVGGGERFIARADESNTAGRLSVTGLRAATEYRLSCECGGAAPVLLSACTLPEAPAGDPPLKIAIIGDPHLTTTRENRNGRLHVESLPIWTAMLDEIAASGCELLLIAGDLVDAGRPEEYDALRRTLRNFPVRLLAVPGNHDVINGGDALWPQLWPQTAFYETIGPIQWLGLDTADGRLDKAVNRAVIDRVDPALPVLVLSHYQLFADGRIADADRVVADGGAILSDYHRRFAAWRGVAYIGHKNIATAVRAGGFTQLNIPQTLHFPAGYLTVDVYPTGAVHRFRPLFSEALNEYSRRGVENQRAQSSIARDGASAGLWNMSVPFAAAEPLHIPVAIPDSALTLRKAAK